MTIEDAIKWIERESCCGNSANYSNWCAALDMAIAALRAQQHRTLDRSRWDGCPNCVRWMVYGDRNYEAAYCRDCGKPLNEAAWVELERRLE